MSGIRGWCPYCDDGGDVEVPVVDNGVGEEQCGPAFCHACGATQMTGEDTIKVAELMRGEGTEREEGVTGWWRGHYGEDEEYEQ